ncbi:hypothetical protein [Xanthomarina spongicola]|uniref:Uncharacterized protein n=1 Tax=Xanthomarina spongicola TaxID=570520 RepID=A0A316E833_9FLAO|nr:hypothetical protein [Xanthomarina spongicola]PWK19050.1 hypothetical protein LX78_01528 [Xanthomarina spongicola]
MREAEFLSYENGFFTFLFENGEELVFDEVLPRVLKQFDLINDESLINKSFKITFIEVYDKNDEDSVIYRVESLKPL